MQQRPAWRRRSGRPWRDEAGSAQRLIEMRNQPFDGAGLRELLAKQPDRTRVRNPLSQRKTQKPHERHAVVDQKSSPLVREIVHRRDDKNFEHYHRIERWPPARRYDRIAKCRDEIGAAMGGKVPAYGWLAVRANSQCAFQVRREKAEASMSRTPLGGESAVLKTLSPQSVIFPFCLGDCISNFIIERVNAHMVRGRLADEGQFVPAVITPEGRSVSL